MEFCLKLFTRLIGIIGLFFAIVSFYRICQGPLASFKEHPWIVSYFLVCSLLYLLANVLVIFFNNRGRVLLIGFSLIGCIVSVLIIIIIWNELPFSSFVRFMYFFVHYRFATDLFIRADTPAEFYFQEFMSVAFPLSIMIFLLQTKVKSLFSIASGSTRRDLDQK